MNTNRYAICPEFAIGTSVVGLKRLDYLGIPFPTRAPFSPVSVRNVGGDKRVYGDGFASCVWEWEENVLRSAMGNLMSFITSIEESGYVYIRTLKNIYSQWGNYYCVEARPILVPVGQNVGAFQPVSVQFTALVEQ